MCTTHRKKKKERDIIIIKERYSLTLQPRGEREKKKKNSSNGAARSFLPSFDFSPSEKRAFFPLQAPCVCVCVFPPPLFFLLLFCLSPVFLSLLTGSTAPAPPPHPRRPDHACCGSKPAAPSRAKTAASNPTRCVRRPSPTCSAPRPGDAESTPP